MATLFIPPQMRDLTEGADRVYADGRSLRQVLAALDAAYPGLGARIAPDDQFAPGLAVSVDGVVTSRGLLTPVAADSEIHILPAIGGG